MATKQTEYHFTAAELEKQLAEFSSKGITELSVHDFSIASDRGKLLHFMQAIQDKAPDLYVTLPVQVTTLDMDVCRAAMQIFCSLDIPLAGVSKSDKNGTVYLFDKKLYAKKATMLNDAGLVFGFDMDYAVLPGDSLKAFRDRLDFALNQYPNHIDFAQLERGIETTSESGTKPTGTFSTQDIHYARDVAFACKTFYSAGRAVPWFLSVLAPLKIQCSRFLADFAEWQRCNNCGFDTRFDPEAVPHQDIEKMQLVFLRDKYEEKHKEALFEVVRDIVTLNGAFARCAGEGVECEIETSYHPDDLLSPEAVKIAAFVDNVLLEPCRVKIFTGQEGPDYKVIN
ncbi:MAG: hypothetical protein K6E51_04000 [Treponema sp.]|nr:hypothetical protein [Treponema sp.]